MRHLTDLFKLLELTRTQVQQGYLLSGIKRDEISGLADHHYLVTVIGWQLATHVKNLGAKIDVQKVMEFCLIHDLGELMGGDISAHYGKINRRARRFAKAFEEENQKFISKFFGPEASKFKKMGKEILNAKSDEALIAKIADYMEAVHYRAFVKNLNTGALDLNKAKIPSFIRKLKDPVAKKQLKAFFDSWIKDVTKRGQIEKMFAQ